MKSSLSRILVGLLAAAGLVGASVNAQAATATGNFNVNVTLTSKCEINGTAAATGAVITDIALAYTSFQTSAATGSTSFNVRCTNSLPYTLALDLSLCARAVWPGMHFWPCCWSARPPSAGPAPSRCRRCAST